METVPDPLVFKCSLCLFLGTPPVMGWIPVWRMSRILGRQGPSLHDREFVFFLFTCLHGISLISHFGTRGLSAGILHGARVSRHTKPFLQLPASASLEAGLPGSLRGQVSTSEGCTFSPISSRKHSQGGLAGHSSSGSQSRADGALHLGWVSEAHWHDPLGR